MSAAPHTIPAPVQQPPVLAPKPVPVQPSSGRPWKWLIALAIIGVVAVLAYRAMNQPATVAPIIANKTGKVAMGDLVRTLRVSGQTTAIQFANITAPPLKGPDANREMVILQTATPGTWVTKGTLIATIDSQSMQDHVDDLGDTIEAARSDIFKRKAEQAIEMENLLQTLRVTKSEADKARLDSRAAEVRTDIERQLLKLSQEEADARYKQAQGDIDFKKAAHAADIRILELTLLRHTRHRDRHVADVKSFSLHAPMDGLIVMSDIRRGNEIGQVQAGDRVFPGQRFMKVVNTKEMQVEGSINQAESSEFRIGQRARIKFDAFPGMEFDGTIHTIGALASTSQRQSDYVRNVPIRVKIEGSDARLIPDLSASADVVIEKAEGKLLVPRAALLSQDGKTVAYARKGETFEPREVSVGLQNDTHAVVLAGLNSGDEVRLN